jgi:hypothetical protein
MGSDDLTIRVLTQIRDGVRETNKRVDKLDARIAQLDERVVDSENRVATEVVALHGTMRDVHTLLKNQLDLRDRVERCERDIDDLRKRIS